jgi:hypothetical protein
MLTNLDTLVRAISKIACHHNLPSPNPLTQLFKGMRAAFHEADYYAKCEKAVDEAMDTFMQAVTIHNQLLKVFANTYFAAYLSLLKRSYPSDETMSQALDQERHLNIWHSSTKSAQADDAENPFVDHVPI